MRSDTTAAHRFTYAQLQDWEAYEEVRKSGSFNMFDPPARLTSGLSPDEYLFVMKNYSALKKAVEAKS